MVKRAVWDSLHEFVQSLTSCNINVFDDGKFLLPIFTLGKYFERDGKRFLPLSIQVHHAVCDGYHIGLFVEKLQNKIAEFDLNLWIFWEIETGSFFELFEKRACFVP